MSAQSFEPFRIDIAQTEVDDLKERLVRTRWADELPPSELERLPTRGPVQPGYQLGVPLSYVKPLVERWRNEYDWRVWEAKLNEQPQFLTNIDRAEHPLLPCAIRTGRCFSPHAAARLAEHLVRVL